MTRKAKQDQPLLTQWPPPAYRLPSMDVLLSLEQGDQDVGTPPYAMALRTNRPSYVRALTSMHTLPPVVGPSSRIEARGFPGSPRV